MAALDEDIQFLLPLTGGQMVEHLKHHPVDSVRAAVATKEGRAILDAAETVMSESPLLAFLHSALCAMSLPVRRPEDEFAPIVRRDGNYTLIIRPAERHQVVDGVLKPVKIGVPFGVHARLVMLFIMSEAVRTQSREIFLGSSFAAWLRRMGINSTDSGGSRSSRRLVQEQVERLMSCEWTIRWDQTPPAADEGMPKVAAKRRKAQGVTLSTFAVNDMRLVNQYGGVTTGEGDFVSRFYLSEQFFESLKEHAVPLNEVAYRALKSSATQIDLYTYLAYRLPRIRKGEEVRLSWEALKAHLGNESSTMFKFRQTVKTAWRTVSGVYQQARDAVSFDERVVRLRYADPPQKGHLHKLPDGRVEEITLGQEPADEGRLLPSAKESLPELEEITWPPNNSIRWGYPELAAIARRHGKGRDIDLIAQEFAKTVGRDIKNRRGERLRSSFTAFCEALDAL